MSHWFITPEQLRANRVTIRGSDAHHLARVQRARVGDEITVADGQGRAYRVRLTAITRPEVVGEVLETISPDPALPVSITLYQAVCKGERMAWLIQKTTELGLARLVPLLTERTVVRLAPSEAAQKRDRWQAIAREAAQQSHRLTLPEVAAPVLLNQALADLRTHDLALALHEAETTQGFRSTLRSYLTSLLPSPLAPPLPLSCAPSPPFPPSPPRLALCVGPEGGFTPAEIDALASAGAVPVTLGPRILRAETAGMVAVVVVMYELGGYDLYC